MSMSHPPHGRRGVVVFKVKLSHARQTSEAIVSMSSTAPPPASPGLHPKKSSRRKITTMIALPYHHFARPPRLSEPVILTFTTLSGCVIMSMASSVARPPGTKDLTKEDSSCTRLLFVCRGGGWLHRGSAVSFFVLPLRGKK